MATTGGVLPIIVWANGGCLRTTISWVPLFERWAAAGFVVIALSVPPGSGLLEMFGTTTKTEHAVVARACPRCAVSKLGFPSRMSPHIMAQRLRCMGLDGARPVVGMVTDQSSVVIRG